MYGRNLREDALKILFRGLRKRLREKIPLREREGVTKDEIERLEEEFRVEMLPPNVLFNGYCYYDYEGTQYNEHPSKRPGRLFVVRNEWRLG